jgi:CheY-like chemotaxis protein
LILLDIRMPGTDGLEIIRRLHGERQTAHIPVVFLTNEDLSLEGEKYTKEMGAQGFIHKSTDLNEFVKRVQGFLEAPVELPPKV